MSFKIHDFDIAEFNGFNSISVDVEGFWSSPVTIWVEQSWQNNKIKVSVNHSSGGFESDFDEIQATRNFAAALIAAADFADEVRNNPEPWIAAKAANDAARKEREEAAQAAKQAKIDADTSIDRFDAEALLESMKQQASDTKRMITTVRRKGGDWVHTIDVRKTGWRGDTRTQFNFDGGVMSRKDLVKWLTTEGAEILGSE